MDSYRVSMAVVPVSPIASGEGDAKAHTANVVTLLHCYIQFLYILKFLCNGLMMTCIQDRNPSPSQIILKRNVF
jgi:hypothetical protein